MRLHLDTDLGGNPDDACALAMVLGWPGAELVGITTTADPDGRRAGYVERLLTMMGMTRVPVVVGAGRSLAGRMMGTLPVHERYWTGSSPPSSTPRSLDDAVDLLSRSVEAGAVLVGIGPWTNLAWLERRHPGALSDVPVVTMGGWVDPFAEGYPVWKPERDWNVQADPEAALGLFQSGAALTFVQCSAAVTASLRTTDLDDLSSSGPVGRLLARQSVTHAHDRGHAELARRHAALPDELVTFLWDPVTCAVALGWDGATVAVRTLRPAADGGVLRFVDDPAGRRTRVVTRVNGATFARSWLTAVRDAQRTR